VTAGESSGDGVSGDDGRPDPCACDTVLVHEVVGTIQGEGPEQGYPICLERLTGCNLRCAYCDSTRAYFEGRRRPIAELVDEIASAAIPRILVTGGEPLCQGGTPALCGALLAAGHRVSIETNGTRDLTALPRGVRRVVDVKTPGSGENGSFRMSNLDALREGDALKFVLTGGEDFRWALRWLKVHTPPGGAQVLLSPAWGVLPPEDLAEMLLKHRPDARLQVQLHKILWGDRPGV